MRIRSAVVGLRVELSSQCNSGRSYRLFISARLVMLFGNGYGCLGRTMHSYGGKYNSEYEAKGEHNFHVYESLETLGYKKTARRRLILYLLDLNLLPNCQLIFL